MIIDILTNALLIRRNSYWAKNSESPFESKLSSLLLIIGLFLILRGCLYFDTTGKLKYDKRLGIIFIVAGVLSLILIFVVEKLHRG